EPVPAGMRGVTQVGASLYLNVALFGGVSQPPVAGAFSATCLRDESTTVATADLLTACSDPDGDAISITDVSAASANGGTVQATDSIITYTPPAGFVGLDTFTYTVADSTRLSAQGTVTVHVQAGGGPVATSTTIASSANPSCDGQDVTFTATVSALASGAIPAGNVSFYDGGTLLGVTALNSNGQGIFGPVALSGGSHSITASFAGTADLAPS